MNYLRMKVAFIRKFFFVNYLRLYEGVKATPLS